MNITCNWKKNNKIINNDNKNNQDTDISDYTPKKRLGRNSLSLKERTIIAISIILRERFYKIKPTASIKCHANEYRMFPHK